MKKTLKALTVGALILVCFIFTNLTLRRPGHEVSFNSSTAKRLSSLVRTTYQQTGSRNVEIRPGEVYYLDQNVLIDTLTINGQLHCHPGVASPLELKAQTIYVNGVFQCGTQFQKISSQVKIILRHSQLNAQATPAYRGLIVNPNGKLIITGQSKGAAWMKLNRTAEAGDNFIMVQMPRMQTYSTFPQAPRSILPIFPWKVGDEIVIASSSFNHSEAEKFTITSINPSSGRIGLSGALQFRHWGQVEVLPTNAQGTVILDERAEVVNLTRPITIMAEEFSPAVPVDVYPAEKYLPTTTLNQTQLGGHVMVHWQGFAAIDSVEFKQMGQAGILGRYPFHWHLVGNANGQFIRNSSVHDSFQRCISIHGTNNTTVHNNVCYNFKGHGYFLEDGNETGNRITNNIGIGAKFPDMDKLLLKSDSPVQSEGQGRFPHVSVFWISHPTNIVKNNIAAGSVGTGFWMSFVKEVKDNAGNILAEPLTAETIDFSYNTAHSSITGITWDGAPMGGSTNNPRNPKDEFITSAHYEPPVTPIFHHLTAYKNTLTGIYFRGDSARFENNLVADNGWSFWLAYNQKVKDTVMVGRSLNNSAIDDQYFYHHVRTDRFKKTGITLYDGPFELENVDFINFPTAAKSYTLNNGQIINSTEVPFYGIGGTDKYVNLVSGLTFSPEPHHRVFLEAGLSQDNGIKDLDGSLTGTPKTMAVWSQSMAILPNSGCFVNSPRFNNMKICPSLYSEPKVVVASANNWWSVPFNVRRNDGQKWNNWNDNKFSSAPSTDVLYQLIFGFEFPNNRVFTWINAETMNTTTGIIKVIGHGNNCRLTHPNVTYTAMGSLSQLKAWPQTAYFREGNDLYYKIVPTQRFHPITPDNTMVGDGYISEQAQLECDWAPFNRAVKGKIESVTKVNSNVVVTGWTCLEKSSERLSTELHVATSGTAPKTLLQTTTANLVSDESVKYDCASPWSSGYSFSFSIPETLANSHQSKYIFVKGKSIQTNKEAWLKNSGVLFLNLNNIVDISYGANGVFFKRPFKEGSLVGCNNQTFGDPLYGVVKACYNNAGRKLANEGENFRVPCRNKFCQEIILNEVLPLQN